MDLFNDIVSACAAICVGTFLIMIPMLIAVGIIKAILTS